jgi:hypothetical protein
MSDRMEGQRKVPDLRIPYEVIATRAFYKFCGSPECRIWHAMARYVVRGRMKTSGLGNKIYEQFYKNGFLCMARGQDDIAKRIGAADKQYVSKYVKPMADKGIIKIKHTVWQNRRVYVYELGTHDMGPHKHETFYLHEYCLMDESDRILADLE